MTKDSSSLRNVEFNLIGEAWPVTKKSSSLVNSKSTEIPWLFSEACFLLHM